MLAVADLSVFGFAGKQPLQRGLAIAELGVDEVHAVEIEKIEAMQDEPLACPLLSASARAEKLECLVSIVDDEFAVDDRRALVEVGQQVGKLAEAFGPVEAVPRQEPNRLPFSMRA